MTAFEVMQKHYRQRDVAAREWKRKGGKVVGYLCDIVPDELIYAAGFFPLRLSGDPWDGIEKTDKYRLIPNSQTSIQNEGFIRSIINMLVSGRYDFLDYLVVPHARDSVHKLYVLLLGMKRADPALKIPELYFMENLHTTFYSAELYNRDRWLDLKKKLEEWAMARIYDESLLRAINIVNENRMLLKKLSALRAENKPRVSGVEALQVIGSSMFMLREEHNRLLEEYLGNIDKSSANDGVRLFVCGSPLDNLQLYEIIESCGATVVAEDNCWGNRYSDVPVDTSIESPIEAIIDRYHRKPPCNRMFPISRRVDYCVQNALDAKAQGVIFNVLQFDDAETWETPDKINALKEKNIPSLFLKNQPYFISEPEKLKTSIKEFIKTINKTAKPTRKKKA